MRDRPQAAIAPDALMDRIYRRQRHVYDISRRYYLLGRDDLIAALGPGPDDSVLEIGCGTARNLISAARHHSHAQFFGLDISAQMLRTARRNIARAGLARRIAVAQGDATRFDPAMLFGRASFDRVFFSYSLSMIPRWLDALDRSAAMVAPGGQLLAVDFGQQSDLPAWFRPALLAWLRRFHVTPRADLGERLEQLAAARRARVVVRSLYRDYARLAVFRVEPP